MKKFLHYLRIPITAFCGIMALLMCFLGLISFLVLPQEDDRAVMYFSYSWILAVFATFPWIRWHFSLRTLLIAITLVAVVLGVLVWMVRQ